MLERVPDVPTDLEDFVPFLVNRVSARLATSFSQAIAKTGLSLAETRALSALFYRGEMRMAALAEATDLQLSTLSRLMRRLEERGYCKIEPRASDERAGIIALTGAGQRLIRDIIALGQRHERAIVKGLSPEDVEAAKRILRAFYANALADW